MDFKFKVGDLVLVRPDLSEELWCDEVPVANMWHEELAQCAGKITTITYAREGEDYDEDDDQITYPIYETTLHKKDEDGDYEWVWSFLECSFIPVTDLETLETALLNGDITLESFVLAKKEVEKV